MARTVEAILKANTSSFESSLTAASARLDQFAASAVAAGAKVDAALGKAGTSAAKLNTSLSSGAGGSTSALGKLQSAAGSSATSLSKLETAQKRAADASGQLRLAQTRLTEVQSKAQAGSAKVVAAEEAHAKASRNLAAAQKDVATASLPVAPALTRSAQSTSKLGTALDAVGKHEAGLNKAARGLTLIGAAGAAGFGVAVKSAADFDQAMSHLSATGADARNNISALRGTILELGASTQYSATEVANASEEMAKAGVTAKDQLGGGLKGALDLAAAGGLSVARAAEIAGTALKQFSLAGQDLPHVADLLAAGANAAVGSVDDLANGLKYVGPVAEGMGVSIDQTVGSLTAFAAAGLVGEQGGTALRGVLLSLTAPSDAAAKTMKQLGINMYDAQGKFIGVDGAAQQLQGALGDLSEADRNAALGRIFGNAQVTAANVLYRGGAALINDYTNQVNDQGAAAEQAAARMDNLRGDVEKLGGSLQTAFISSGEGVQGPFRDLTQGLTGLVDGFNAASGAKQGFALAIIGVGAAGALAAAGVIKIVQAASAARAALAALKISAATAGIATAGIAAGLVIGAIAFQHYAQKAAETRQRVGELSDALQQSNGAIDENIAQMRAKSLVESGAADAANRLGISTADLAQASLGNADATERVNVALDAYNRTTQGLNPNLDKTLAAQDKMGPAAAKVREAIQGGNAEIDKAQTKYRQLTEATNAVIGSTGGLTDAQTKAYQAYNAVGASLDALSGPLTLTAQQSQQLSQQLFAGGQAAIQASNAHIGYEQSVTAANKAIKDNGRTLSESTEKGQANKQALNQLAASGQAYVQSLVAQGAGSRKAAAATKDVRAGFIDAARAAGLGKTAARELADSYGLIPKKITTTFDSFGLALQQNQVEEFRNKLAALPKNQQARIQAIFEDKGAKAAKQELDRLNKNIAKPKITLTGADKAKAAADKTTAALKKTGATNAGPKIITPSDAARKRANDTTAALKKTGATNPKPKIGDPGTAAKKRADDATAALKRTGAQKPSPRINVSSNAAQAAASARRQMNIPDTSATIRIRTVKTTKNVTEAGPNSAGRKAEGGMIEGWSPSSKADNIPIMATAREFMQPVASVDYYGLGVMEGIRTRSIPKSALQGFANGGQIGVGPQRLATGGSVVDVGALVRLIAALNNPLAQLAASTRAVAVAQVAVNVENRKIARPKAVFTAADRGYTAAKDAKAALTLENARQTAAAKRRVAEARADVNSGKATKAERKELQRATAAAAKVSRDNAKQNAEATAKVTKTSAARTKALTAYNLVAEKSKAATDKLKEAQAALAQQQQAVADTARQVAATLSASADTTSTDPLDILARKTETAQQLAIFNQRLAALRKSGLNDTDINGIVGRGAEDGIEVADGILKGGKKLVDALNTAQANLDKAANAVGYTAATGVIKRASGGWVDGQSGTDTIKALLTRREFVVNDKSAMANAGLLEYINDSRGRNISRDLVRGVMAYGGGGMGGSVSNSHSIDMPIHIANVGYSESRIVQKVQGGLMDTLTMAGLNGVSF